MKELGTHSADLHAGLAPAIVDAKVAKLILLGDETRPLEAALAGEVEIERAGSVDEAAELVCALLRPGDAVLVKASNSVGLAKLVDRVSGGIQSCST